MKPSSHVRRQLQREKKDNELAEIEKLEKLLSSQAPEKGVRYGTGILYYQRCWKWENEEINWSGIRRAPWVFNGVSMSVKYRNTDIQVWIEWIRRIPWRKIWIQAQKRRYKIFGRWRKSFLNCRFQSERSEVLRMENLVPWQRFSVRPFLMRLWAVTC